VTHISKSGFEFIRMPHWGPISQSVYREEHLCCLSSGHTQINSMLHVPGRSHFVHKPHFYSNSINGAFCLLIFCNTVPYTHAQNGPCLSRLRVTPSLITLLCKGLRGSEVQKQCKRSVRRTCKTPHLDSRLRGFKTL